MQKEYIAHARPEETAVGRKSYARGTKRGCLLSESTTYGLNAIKEMKGVNSTSVNGATVVQTSAGDVISRVYVARVRDRVLK